MFLVIYLFKSEGISGIVVGAVTPSNGITDHGNSFFVGVYGGGCLVVSV
jgi:hypothetical protein